MTLYDQRGEFLTPEEMTTLEYILYDQCNSRKFGPIEPERRALEGERFAKKEPHFFTTHIFDGTFTLPKM